MKEVVVDYVSAQWKWAGSRWPYPSGSFKSGWKIRESGPGRECFSINGFRKLDRLKSFPVMVIDSFICLGFSHAESYQSAL